MDEIVTIETSAVTDSNIANRLTFFLGIPIIIVLGWLNNKYVSIFSVENNGHRLVVLYSGICPVLKNDRVRITGQMDYGGKVGVYGTIMKALIIENMDTGDVYRKKAKSLE